MDQRDLSIIAQNAGTTAAVLYNATVGNTGDWLPEAFDEIREHLFKGVVELVAAGQVQQAFQVAVPAPNTSQSPVQAPPVPQPVAPQQYAPPPVPQAAPAAPGGPVPCPKCHGETWDNRTTKRNPKAPDYKCKNKDTCDGAVWNTPFPGR